MSSERWNPADVWYADERLGADTVEAAEVAGATCIEAVAIDRRERTRSKGYVAPGQRSALVKLCPGKVAEVTHKR